MNLPGCQQPPGKACSKEAAYARGAVHVVAASFFPRESSGRTLEGGLASSREPESRAMWAESQQPASSIDANGLLYAPLPGSGYSSGSGGPCCQLWHAASEHCRCPDIYIHLPK